MYLRVSDAEIRVRPTVLADYFLINIVSTWTRLINCSQSNALYQIGTVKLIPFLIRNHRAIVTKACLTSLLLIRGSDKSSRLDGAETRQVVVSYSSREPFDLRNDDVEQAMDTYTLTWLKNDWLRGYKARPCYYFWIRDPMSAINLSLGRKLH